MNAFQDAGGLVWPEDVRNAKVRIDKEMKAVLHDAQSCITVPVDVANAFVQFYDGWRAFYCGSTTEQACAEPYAPIFGSGAQMDECEQFETDLAGWQKKIGSYGCQSVAPSVVPPSPGQVVDVAKYAVWGLGILAVLYVLHESQILKLSPGRRAAA